MECNQIQISGVVAEVKKPRSTPAGVPISSFILLHRSRQMEGGVPRVVECELQVQLTGSEFEATRAELAEGKHVVVQGILSRQSHKQAKALKVLASEVNFA